MEERFFIFKKWNQKFYLRKTQIISHHDLIKVVKTQSFVFHLQSGLEILLVR